MTPFEQFPQTDKSQIRYILTDIDDTLTHKGRLVADAFTAMDKLKRANYAVIPITGRPAGWCDHIARMWPVDGVVGENGAFYFCYDEHRKKMYRRYWKTTQQKQADQRRLDALKHKILQEVPGCRISADQSYREADLAIDFCEDVPALPEKDIHRIVHLFANAGATAKISSIHVNGWFGDYDKLAMARLMFKERFQCDPDKIKQRVIYCGDSPNDAPMFAFFPYSVGVANIFNFKDEMDSLPTWVTKNSGGYGFAEMVNALLKHQ